MSTKTNFNISNKEYLNKIKNDLLDPQAKEITEHVKWIHINGFSEDETDLYPVVIVGEGNPVLLLHGFDSCFLEYRRLIPLLKEKNQLIIPDLFGFGFCPRPQRDDYGMESIINFLNQILEQIDSKKNNIGLIGASMGGGIAMELARQNPKRINRILLLSPAGLTGKKMKVPWPLNQMGACFLSNRLIRKSLCRQAFSDPNKSVGKYEEQIASIHIKVPGWKRSLASFAKNGGVANCGAPLPSQPIHVICGANDRIITQAEKEISKSLLSGKIEQIDHCGHLPHLENPELIAKRWEENH